ncbi:MAG: restriction endonuclease subunit R [Candidatus Parabeggiatoa sp. nov. 1]|nr:MAG: restriction endonuclease subunit R [Gammaproteobacteria bacterium]
MKSSNESDTRAKFITPMLHQRGWTEDLIKREVSACEIVIINGEARKYNKGHADYLLRVKIFPDAQPIAIAVIEAKRENAAPTEGFEQAKAYATSKRLNVPFAYSTNGHLFVEYDQHIGKTTEPRPLSEFPTPQELRQRYEKVKGFSLSDKAAQPLSKPYTGGESVRRYYQDAAIRAILEKIAYCETHHLPKRVLISLATGAGKTRIAVHLLKRIADAGQINRVLFVCDRDELRSQANNAFQDLFGSNAAIVTSSNPQKNARVLIATYQTLGLEADDDKPTFLLKHYPENYFSHIVIDECHRSAWGKWAQVLTYNSQAVQIGLTATPRELVNGDNEEAKITADNIKYFGSPVYEYDIGQGIADGYLATCEIIKRDILLDGQNEKIEGVTRRLLKNKKLSDADTGQTMSILNTRKQYQTLSLERLLLLPERVKQMSEDLFQHLLATGNPTQKTIIFCATDRHADAIAIALNNLYTGWCQQNNQPRLEEYTFKCTTKGRSDYLSDLREASRSHFIATTVDLLTTGVDVPCVRNIVFFKYVKSPIAFYQMLGRGTRLDAATNKLMFRLYDYTDATRLFGLSFLTKLQANSEKQSDNESLSPEPKIQALGFEVKINDAGRCLVLPDENGIAKPVTIAAYKTRLAEKLVKEAPRLEVFRRYWLIPQERQDLLSHLPEEGRSLLLLRTLEELEDYDIYDILANLGYNSTLITRKKRTAFFLEQNEEWLNAMPDKTAATVKALVGQFEMGGTDALESPQIFKVPEVMLAGGHKALSQIGKPFELLQDTKGRIFAL